MVITGIGKLFKIHNLLSTVLGELQNNVAIVSFNNGKFVNKKTNFNHDTLEVRKENYIVKNDTIVFIYEKERNKEVANYTVEFINEDEIILRNIMMHRKSEKHLTRVKKFHQSKNKKQVKKILIENPIIINRMNSKEITSSKFDFLDRRHFTTDKYRKILTWNLIDDIVDGELFIKFHREIYPIQITKVDKGKISGIGYNKEIIEITKQAELISPAKFYGKWDLINTYTFPYNIENKYYLLEISDNKIKIRAKKLTKDTKTFYYKRSNNNETFYLYKTLGLNSGFTKDILFIRDYGNSIAKITLELSDGSSYNFIIEKSVY